MVRPGQFAKVRAVFDEVKGATVIPTRAVTEIQGQYVVYAVGSDNKAQFRKIQLGPKIGGLQIIEQGSLRESGSWLKAHRRFAPI